MKAIVIGASLSGKTTLVKYLRGFTKLLIAEIDEELTRLNNGEFPTDNEYKHRVLAPQIVKVILSKQNIVFFTNTDYFTVEDLKLAKNNGFKIIQLGLSLKQLNERNEKRISAEGYHDLSQYLEGMVHYQKELKTSGVVDNVINANLPVEMIAKELTVILKG